jgi:putative flavoprotein involved in K+ transport
MHTNVLIIGGGQAGLAMSRCLTDRSVDHVVLERGGVGQSWRTERWDSLRLLTPNWMTRLPGFAYTGADPDGYLAAHEVVELLDAYRGSFDAPVQTGTTVTAVSPSGAGYRVDTDQGPWWAQAVVIATGAASDPHVPEVAGSLPPTLHQLPAIRYRHPDQLPDGGVLVVGASASGVQIADELRRAGRAVTIAVGDHVRVPRSYRGRDIHWWLDALGQLDERYDEVDDLARARRLPSLQLIGSSDRRTLDLATLSAAGVDLAGRLVGVARGRGQFSGSLANHLASADLKQHRLLERIDQFVDERPGDPRFDGLGPIDRPARFTVDAIPAEIDLADFPTVVWATGYRPRYPWLDQNLLDPAGRLRHDGGVVDAPGLYVLGLPFQRRRKSAFLDGVGRDAEALVLHLMHHLDTVTAAA